MVRHNFGITLIRFNRHGQTDMAFHTQEMSFWLIKKKVLTKSRILE